MNDHVETPTDILEQARNLPGMYPEISMFDPCPLHGKGGLDRVWKGQTFVNPPFSDITPWVLKALESEGPVVLLLPSRTSSLWFKLLWESPRKKYFDWLPRRIWFVGQKEDAPFDCFLVVIQYEKPRFIARCADCLNDCCDGPDCKGIKYKRE